MCIGRRVCHAYDGSTNNNLYVNKVHYLFDEVVC